jgi:hypothetical protein
MDVDGVAFSCAGGGSGNRRAVGGTAGTLVSLISGVFAGSATTAGTAAFATGSVTDLGAGGTVTRPGSAARAISFVSDGFFSVASFASVATGFVSSGFSTFAAAGSTVIFSCCPAESFAFTSGAGKA